MPEPRPAAPPAVVRRERWRLLYQVTKFLDGPMTVLAFVWLGLLILDLTRGLSGVLSTLNTVIWALFVAHFLLEFVIAPAKGAYLRRNWLTALALVLPALRVLRVFRAFRAFRAVRAVRSVGLLRLLTSLNRGMGATRRVLQRYAAGYVAALTLLVVFAGAAGMYAFESPHARRDAGLPAEAEAGALDSYGEAVWWTAMTMTTMGADTFPKTSEGRALGWLLAVYAFAIFGYLTATIASYLVGRPDPAGPPLADLAGLRAEVAALRVELAAARRLEPTPRRNGPAPELP
jgi:voltage-gated potassium channel